MGRSTPQMLALDRNQNLFGMFVELPTPASVEIAAHAGWDFVVIDCEHAPISQADLPGFIRAAEASAISAIVRLPSLTVEWMQAALDCGAAAVQVPQIASVAAARQAVEWARFHPIGKRGFNPFVRAANYSAEPALEFMERSNRDVALILQLESAAAVEAVEEIANIAGLDALFIGPYDLSQSLGVPGEVTHPKVLAAGQRVIDAATKAGLAAAIFVNNHEAAKQWQQMGARWISYSTDTFLLSKVMRKERLGLA